MKNLHIKKNIVGFKPEIHWKLILSSMLFLLCIGVMYDVYIYIYGRQQIELTNTKMSELTKATSTVNVSMEDVFEIYKARKTVYEGIITTLTLRSPATTTVATSSK